MQGGSCLIGQEAFQIEGDLSAGFDEELEFLVAAQKQFILVAGLFGDSDK